LDKAGFAYLPPVPESVKFDRLISYAAQHAFPFLRDYWKKPLPLQKMHIDRGKWVFSQFAGWYMQAMYRRWLRQATCHIIQQPFGPENLGVPSLRKFVNYSRCYNCPTSFCRYRVFTKNKEAGIPPPCWRSFCPHCHIRKVNRYAKRMIKAVRRVSSYYQNLHTFRYKTSESTSHDPKELKKLVCAFFNKCRNSRLYLGGMWYIYPRIGKNSDDIKWSARVLILAGGSFEKTPDPAFDDFTLRKMYPAKPHHIYAQVGKTMTWGQWPFWYSSSATRAWDRSIRKRLGGRDAMHSGKSYLRCSIFEKFEKKNHKKNVGRYLPFERTTS
jgi:hypothetical protein